MAESLVVLAQKAAQKFATPFYLYDLNQIRARGQDFRANFAGARLFYALKANPNLAILRLMRELDIGAEAVSAGEVLRAYHAGFEPEQIVWNGPAKKLSDLELKPLPYLALDNFQDLARVAAHSKGARVLIRVNPDLPVETHASLATGLGSSQFGFLPEQIPAALRAVREAGLELLGFSLHLGSNLERAADFEAGYELIGDLSKRYGPFPVIDLGGGFAPKLNLESLAQAAQAAAGESQIWLEPGRSLVAEAGVLVTQVMAIKETRRPYLILDAGMSVFIRPMLYGARHPVVPLYGGGELREFDLAGPGCESGDILARGVRLPTPKPGDLVAVLQTGAYGAAMSSHYLDEPTPLEIGYQKEFSVLRSKISITKLINDY